MTSIIKLDKLKQKILSSLFFGSFYSYLLPLTFLSHSLFCFACYLDSFCDSWVYGNEKVFDFAVAIESLRWLVILQYTARCTPQVITTKMGA